MRGVEFVTNDDHPGRIAQRSVRRAIWNTRDRTAAEAELDRLVKDYAGTAPKLARWLEQAIPEGLQAAHAHRNRRGMDLIRQSLHQYGKSGITASVISETADSRLLYPSGRPL